MRGRDVAVKEEGQEKTLERVKTWGIEPTGGHELLLSGSTDP